MLKLESSGSFAKTTKFLEFLQSNRMFNVLDRYGREGVDALSRATPRETGETAGSWRYTVTHTAGRHAINWYNTHKEDGVNIAVILQYGHGTGTGGYVEGIDYINPAIRPVFDRILEDIWRQVTNG
jgi:hypothetical protein